LSKLNDGRGLENSDAFPECQLYNRYANDGGTPQETQCRNPFGIQLGDGQELRLQGLVPTASRSLVFTMNENETFVIEGLIVEGDNQYEDRVTAHEKTGGIGEIGKGYGYAKPAYTYAYLGGLSGLGWEDGTTTTNVGGETKLAIFNGTTLLNEKQSFLNLRFPFETSDTRAVGETCDYDQDFASGTETSVGHDVPACIRESSTRMGVQGYMSVWVFISNVRTEFGSKANSTGSNLLAESIGNNSDAQPLTADQAQPLLAQAIDRFAAAGVDVSSLSNVQILMTDLPGTTLGQAVGNNTIYLDRNAAGYGWFVDNTPWDDFEFSTPGDQGEQDRIDALTVITHELGHLLGLAHDDHGVMQPTLAAGNRHLPDATDLLDDEILDALLAAWAE